jgi:hypothetical protein
MSNVHVVPSGDQRKVEVEVAQKTLPHSTGTQRLAPGRRWQEDCSPS